MEKIKVMSTVLEHIEKIQDVLTDELLDEKVEQWHQNDSQLPLYEYLGMTIAEYNQFLTGKEKRVLEPIDIIKSITIVESELIKLKKYL